MGKEADGLDGDEVSEDQNDFSDYATELKEKYEDDGGEPEEAVRKEDTPEEEAQAEDDGGDSFKDYVGHLNEKYGQESGETGSDFAQETETDSEQPEGSEGQSEEEEPQVATTPDDGGPEYDSTAGGSDSVAEGGEGDDGDRFTNSVGHPDEEHGQEGGESGPDATQGTETDHEQPKEQERQSEGDDELQAATPADNVGPKDEATPGSPDNAAEESEGSAESRCPPDDLGNSQMEAAPNDSATEAADSLASEKLDDLESESRGKRGDEIGQKASRKGGDHQDGDVGKSTSAEGEDLGPRAAETVSRVPEAASEAGAGNGELSSNHPEVVAVDSTAEPQPVAPLTTDQASMRRVADGSPLPLEDGSHVRASSGPEPKLDGKETADGLPTPMAAAGGERSTVNVTIGQESSQSFPKMKESASIRAALGPQIRPMSEAGALASQEDARMARIATNPQAGRVMVADRVASEGNIQLGAMPLHEANTTKGIFLTPARGENQTDSTASESERILARLQATAQRNPSHEHATFCIVRGTIERTTGFRFEAGKFYDVKGVVDGQRFSVLHRADSKSLTITMTEESGAKFERGRRYDIDFISITERTTLPVTRGERGLTLSFRRTLLESQMIDTRSSVSGVPRVLEHQVQNLRTGRRDIVFDRLVRPGVSVFGVESIGGRAGDLYRSDMIRDHSLREFLEHFEKLKPIGLENLDLRLKDGKLALAVFGKELPLKSYSIDAKNLESVLRVRTEGSYKDLRFWLDGRSIRPTLGRDGRILGLISDDDRISLLYLSGGRVKKATVWREAEWKGPVMTSKEISDLVKITHTSAREDGTTTWFGINRSVADYASLRLDGLSGGRYFRMKGDIGEEACAGILTAMGWEELMRHPFGGEGRGSYLHGPDSLMAHNSLHGRQLGEYKWHKYHSYATAQGTDELRTFIKKNSAMLQRNDIAGAYVASLRWNGKESEGSIDLKKAWPND